MKGNSLNDNINSFKNDKILEISPPQQDTEDKKIEEGPSECNTDSNKSNLNFAIPKSNITSSSGSASRDYIKNKSTNNLNILFNQDGRQNSRRVLSNAGCSIDSSPLDKRFGLLNDNYSNFNPSHILFSPIDTSKLSYMKRREGQNPSQSQMFNNEAGNNVNIEHRPIYNSGIFNNNTYVKRISFQNAMNEKGGEGEMVKTPHPMKTPEQIYFTGRGQREEPFPFTIPERILLSNSKDKKHRCNCKRSRCLKLYCECFANGEFCRDCNCIDCSNVVENYHEKELAFKYVKDRNPVAMKLVANPNFPIEDHPLTDTKIGCNCTKSNCLKKYCECYKAGVTCNESCRCRECSNMLHAHEEKRSSHNQNEFAVEKISVLILSGEIFVTQSKFTLNEFDEHLLKYSAVQVKNESDGFVLEIEKRKISRFMSQVDTPNFHRKRQREHQSAKVGSMRKLSMLSDSGFNKTACDSNYKTKFPPQDKIDNVVKKRLNMEEY